MGGFPPNYVVSIGSVLMTADLNVSLVGYGPVEIRSNHESHDVIDIHMPHLPFNSNLKWAWAFRLENAEPVVIKTAKSIL